MVSQDDEGHPQYELWINNKAKGYAPPAGFTPVKMPKGSGQVSFGDFGKFGVLILYLFHYDFFISCAIVFTLC